jgi:hypothetical protein
MKKINLFLLAALTTVFSANAGVLTVSNNSNSPGQYSDLASAVSAANSGDTLLVAGSPTSYAGVTISKEVHIIGVGYKPSKDLPMVTKIGSVTFRVEGLGTLVSPYLSASGSSIEGCYLVDDFHINGVSGSTITNIVIKRNYFILNRDLSINAYCSGILIYNNILSAFDNAGSNVILANNIIREPAGSTGVSGASIIKNNLFIGTSIGLAVSYYTNVSNNIFYASALNQLNSTFTTYTNNISYNSSNNNFPMAGTNSGSGNMINVNPNFVSDANYTFDDTDDFNLNAGSPAINAGSDGTDIGIYGGSYPWPDGGVSGSGFMYSQEPQIPQVNEMNIQNTSVPTNGTLNVQIKGIINQ